MQHELIPLQTVQPKVTVPVRADRDLSAVITLQSLWWEIGGRSRSRNKKYCKHGRILQVMQVVLPQSGAAESDI